MIVKEGQYEDCIWFVRSGSCRVLKLMRFAKVPILVGGSGYHLQPIMSDAQMLQRERNRKLLNGLGFDESKSRRNSIMVQVTSADGDVEEKKKHQMTTGPLDNIAKENILTKLLIVRELFAGDFFGEHPNSLINATDMREKSMSTDGKVITSTPSNVSVISNNRCELVGIAR